jgi:hypothetical protein
LKNELPPKPQSNSGSEGSSRKEDPSTLEEVRQRLQTFGYLNGRIERFYRGSLKRSASQLFNRCLLSLRVGLLSGTLAALLMTSGTLLFNISLLRNWFDLVLLFFYFEVFFVVVFSLLELALIYLVSLWLRIGGGRRLVAIGQAFSFLTGLGFFIYFLYWGWSRAGILRLLPEYFIATIVVVLLISCVLVARCTWVGFVVAFRESNLYPELPNWRRRGYEVILALAALIILVPVVLKQSGERKTEEPPVAVLSTTDRWIVIGVDGVSLDLLRRFSANGDLPNFNQLLSDSFVSKLQFDGAGVPPVAWTTVATGVTPEEHGILMPEVRRLGGVSSWMQMTPFELAFHSVLMHAGLGQRQPVSGYMRQTKAFWEILSDSGIQTGIVNWWGSWPARELRGWNISERYYYKVVSANRSQDDTYPPELFGQYRSLAGKTSSKIDGAALDRFYTSVFKSLSQRMPVRVAALYLPGEDILNYEFVERKEMDAFTYTARYREHLKWLDEQIGEISAQNSNYSLCIVLSAGRSLPGHSSGVVIHGPESWKRGLIQDHSFAERSITPLILYTCGVPVARSMNGELLKAVLPQQFLARVPIRTVNAYIKKDRMEIEHAGEFNDLLVEQMKSLGYLQ